MHDFFHYLLTLFNGNKRWHVALLIALLLQVGVAAWFLHQQGAESEAHVEQLFSLNAQSALMASHAVAISQLELNAFEKLASSVEGYQQGLDVLRPSYQKDVSDSWQTFKQLSDIWQPVREAVMGLLSSKDKLSDLRIAVEDTDQRLPDVLTEHNLVIDELRVALRKPASLRLLREQRIILQRMAANTNAATASVLSAVNVNARAALTSSIEADLFLLEKSLEIMSVDNKEALEEAKQDGSDVSLLLKINAIAQRLAELAISIRKVMGSLVVTQDINKHVQLLVEDSGLLITPVQQLVKDRLQLTKGFTKERLSLYFAIALVMLWLLYMAYCHVRTVDAERVSLSIEKDSTQEGIDNISRQMAAFSEGDHAITVRVESINCRHLAGQANRMVAYVGLLDKQIEKDFLPLVKGLAKAEAGMVATIDRQANDIARLSVGLSNIVSGQTSASTELAGHLVQTQSQLQSLIQHIDQAALQLSDSEKGGSTDITAHAVRQLQQHIDDRLHSLAKLSQRINLEVIDTSTSLAGRPGSDRAVRRAMESLQSLTGRYHGQVNDIMQLLVDMTSSMSSLLQQIEKIEGVPELFDHFQSSVLSKVNKVDVSTSEFARAIAGADRSQARHTETISLVLDELQDGNQRLLVAATESDLCVRKLDKLIATQVNVVAENDSQQKVES
ncbi:MAG: hypothetical protein GXP21_00895 [Gammaproteobacteria bacterium]|nr:hypothetical protein [Gammaproteobacteria bacterium]